MKGISKVGEWEREFQVVPYDHMVFNGKPTADAKPDTICGAFIKRRVRMEETRGCLEAATSLFLGVAGNNVECLMWYDVWTKRQNHLQHCLQFLVPPDCQVFLYTLHPTSHAGMTSPQLYHDAQVDSPGTLNLCPFMDSWCRDIAAY